MLGSITRKSAAALLVALTTLLAAPTSQASVWYGSWDPLFGDPFLTTSSPAFSYNLGWGGGQGGTFVNVQVNAPCGPLPLGVISNAGTCGGNAVVQSATVLLYDFDVGQTPVLSTLTFNPTLLAIDYLDFGADSRLKATNTALSDWVVDTGAVTGAEFALQFVIDPAVCPLCAPSFLDLSFPSLDGYTGAVLFARLELEEGEPCDGDIAYVCFEDFKVYRANVIEFPALVTYVPEPGAVALLTGSLLAAGVAARRRRNASN